METIRTARILIADGDAPRLRPIVELLQHGGYTDLRTARDASALAALCAELEPDLVVVDLAEGGLALLEEIGHAVPRTGYVPILVVCESLDEEAKNRALTLGAKDFLHPSTPPLQALASVRGLLERRRSYLALRMQKALLDDPAPRGTEELQTLQEEILDRLGTIIDDCDIELGGRARRVGTLSAAIAREIGLDEATAEKIRRATLLYDVGNIAIPQSILLKPATLSVEEYAVVQTHTTIGAEILGDSSMELFQLAEQIAGSHHERWDGAGYPRGLHGTQIPLPGRIVAVADTFDALSNDRPYRKAWPLPTALAVVETQAGRVFDPDVVAAFLRVHTGKTRLSAVA